MCLIYNCIKLLKPIKKLKTNNCKDRVEIKGGKQEMIKKLFRLEIFLIFFIYFHYYYII